MLTVAVLISGAGSNLSAFIDETRSRDYPARIVAVGADRDAEGLSHAARAGIPTFVVSFRDYDSRESWGAALASRLESSGADVIVLSGLMRLLPATVVSRFSPRIINTHPAYLPEFPGAHAVRDALEAGATRTGASVIVVAEGVDDGPILARERVAIVEGDTEESLHGRIKPVERRLLADVVRRIALGELDLSAPPPVTAAPTEGV